MTKKKKLLLFLVKLLCSSRIREDVGVVLCFPFIVFHDEFKTSSRSQLLGGAHSLNFVVNNFVFKRSQSASLSSVFSSSFPSFSSISNFKGQVRASTCQFHLHVF